MWKPLCRGDLRAYPRMTIEVSVVDADVEIDLLDHPSVHAARRFGTTALNDAVLTAGEPFHMLELEICADGQTPHPLPGGWARLSQPLPARLRTTSRPAGPIISPSIDAMCVTPICPHSLAFRPVVISPQSTIEVRPLRVNLGTTLICDGQATTRLNAGDRVIIHRGRNDVLIVENPPPSGMAYARSEAPLGDQPQLRERRRGVRNYGCVSSGIQSDSGPDR